MLQFQHTSVWRNGCTSSWRERGCGGDVVLRVFGRSSGDDLWCCALPGRGDGDVRLCGPSDGGLGDSRLRDLPGRGDGVDLRLRGPSGGGVNRPRSRVPRGGEDGDPILIARRRVSARHQSNRSSPRGLSAVRTVWTPASLVVGHSLTTVLRVVYCCCCASSAKSRRSVQTPGWTSATRLTRSANLRWNFRWWSPILLTAALGTAELRLRSTLTFRATLRALVLRLLACRDT